MPVEEQPSRQESCFARPLGLATSLVLRAPRLVLAVAVLLAAAAAALAAGRLELHTNRLDLLNRHSEFNKRWLAYLEQFGDEDDIIVVVQGTEPLRVTQAIEVLAQQIEQDPAHFTALLYKTDLTLLQSKGLHFASWEELQQLERLLLLLDSAVHQGLLQGNWPAVFQAGAGQVIPSAENAAAMPPGSSSTTADQALAEATAHWNLAVDSMLAALTARAYISPWSGLQGLAVGMQQFQGHYLLSNEGRMGFLLLRLTRSQQSLVRNTRSLAMLRELMRQVEQDHPDVTIGATGLPVLEHDEMQASQADMTISTLVSLVGVAVLFVAGFGSLRHPLLATLTLVLGMAWTFGAVTLTIGHLNILSISFAVILIGLGIDFGIHYVARYLQLRGEGRSVHLALRETASSVGPGVITGGVTTALAFLMAYFTEFTGLAELGAIAGLGIVLCLLAGVVVLPALILLADRQRGAASIPTTLPVEWMFWPAIRLPRGTLLLVLLVAAPLAGGLTWLEFDYNLLNLQPLELESVALEKQLLENTDRSVWFAVSVADSPEELVERKQQFLQLPTVLRVEDMASLLTASHPYKQSSIARIGQLLGRLGLLSGNLAVPSREAVDSTLAHLQQFVGQHSPALAGLHGRLGELRSCHWLLPEEVRQARLNSYQQQAMGELQQFLQMLRTISQPDPPVLEDLPASLAARFVGQHGTHLLRIYAQGDIWDMDALEQFVRDVESVDPAVTGHPIQTYYASRQMRQSYLQAAEYALLAIVLVVLLDFRSLRYSLLALLPVLLGMLLLFGTLGWMRIPLNAANFLVLPLILGIGIDYGVHVLHDYRSHGRVDQLRRSTAIAILLSSGTTILGFGTLIGAQHQGLRSLGQVLVLGVFFCALSSVVVVPAVLQLASATGRPAATPGHGNAAAQLVGELAPGLPSDGSRSADPWGQLFVPEAVRCAGSEEDGGLQDAA